MQVRKAIGAHYTPAILADFVAREIVDAWSHGPTSSDGVQVLDPASGDGELLLSTLKELSNRGYYAIEVYGFDTDQAALDSATSRIQAQFPRASLSLRSESFLEFVLSQRGSTQFNGLDSESFDLIIANPPYVRTQVLGAKKSQALAKQFGLRGRVDLYHAFILGIAEVLRPGGVAGIIVSNRFMTTKAGASVRKSIIEAFDVLHVWDLGDTRLFEAAVLPAVLLVRRKHGESKFPGPKFTAIYSTQSTSPARQCLNVIEALTRTGGVQLENGQRFYVQQGTLDHGGNPSDVWHITNKALDIWFSTVRAHTFCTFADVGKVRVGVKTTADKVFIRSDWEEMPEKQRPELLRPLTTHHIARRYKALSSEPRTQILYPHQVIDGKRVAVNLQEYPRSARYLSRHRPVLDERKYLTKTSRKWYEIWVPQDPNAWHLPKIVFRDIAETPTFWMDLSGSVVNGDCYWLSCEDPKRINLLWLALAVGNSSFIEAFYDRRFRNKLYGGRRRFMTQYVERFPIPDPDTSLSRRIIRTAKDIYDLLPSPAAKDLEKELDELVCQAFGVSIEEIAW